MIRVISLLGMTSGFLIISPSLRGSALLVLGRVIFVFDQYRPYSYVVAALVLGTAAIFSLAAEKPQ
jgi:hypothetical protein